MSVLPVGIGASGDEGYTIDNSLRFRSAVGASLSKTFSTPTDNNKWTYSLWFKRGTIDAGYRTLFGRYVGGTNFIRADFLSDKFRIYQYVGGIQILVQTAAVFRDPSAWYHLTVVLDTSNSTSTDRVIFYVNGIRVTSFSSTTYPSLNLGSVYNVSGGASHYIGSLTGSGDFDGYMTEINFIDGQALTADDFGEFDDTTGVWKPKAYSGTYGTNGFYLENGRGTDQSGNSNNWTENNFNTSTPSSSGYDVMTDVPTLTDENTANYPTFNPLQDAATLSNSNLKLTGISTYCGRKSTMAIPSTGKWYWETDVAAQYTAAGYWFIVGMCTNSLSLAAYSQANADSVAYGDRNDGRAITNGTSIVTQNSVIDFSTGDVLQCAYDADTGKFWFGKNNAWWDSSAGTTGDPANGTNQTLTAADKEWFPYVQVNATNNVATINFGQQPFAYTPPTGFKALNTYNLPDSTIVNGSEHFNTVTFSGNGSAASVTGVGFQPDLIWAKNRTNAYNAELWDALRGVNSTLFPNQNYLPDSTANRLVSFDSDGFSYGTNSNIYVNGTNSVAWNWKANGSGTSNSAGTNGASIASTYSANTTSGLSIVTYSGTGSSGTVYHGLGSVPEMMIFKTKSGAVDNWFMYHDNSNTNPASTRMLLNLSNTRATNTTYLNATAPTANVLTVGTDSGTNLSTNTYVAYIFAPVEGFSAFGSYTGNGSSDGPFVYTGFRPAWWLVKNVQSAEGWYIFDSARNPYNVTNAYLFANATNAESTSNRDHDLLSNGFKIRNTNGAMNTSGITYIYAAFAENPFKNSLAR